MSARCTAACLAALSFLLAGPALAADRHVPSEYPTIQAAIDASSPGDTVIVASGVYSGPGNVNVFISSEALPSITVRSETENPDDCIIDCGYGARGITLYGNVDDVISGFTITHADQFDEAILVYGGSVLNCRIVDNAADGLVSLGPGDIFYNCVFRNNNGRGALVGDSADFEFCVFDSNLGGGIVGGVNWVYGSTFANQPVGAAMDGQLESSTFTGNAAGVRTGSANIESSFTGNGTGVQIADGGDATISGTFEGNGVAIQIEPWAHLDLSGSTLTRNGAAILGADGTFIRLWNSRFQGNGGWAVDVGRWPDCVAVNCIFVGNGGGMRCVGDPDLEGVEQMCAFLSTFVDNAGGALLDTDPDLYNWTFVKHSIVWNNGPQDFIGTFAFDSDVSTEAPYSEGTFTLLPLFVREPSPGPDGVWGTPDDDYGDLHLRPGSPCINRAGPFLYPYEDAEFDIEGRPRIIGTKADLGPYEFPYGLQLISLTKTSAYVGGGSITVTATGAFPGGSMLTWNGRPVPTTRVSATSLRTVLTPEMLSTAGVFPIAIWTGIEDYPDDPPNNWSNPIDFTVLNRVPSILYLSPAIVSHGGPAFTLQVTGARFVPSSVVCWNGVARPTTYNASTSLSIPVSAADIAAIGKAAITVVSPGPGGGTSNVKRLAVQ